MRASALAGSLALVFTACAHAPPLRPALATQADARDPRSAQVEVSGVRLTVRAADWHGEPGDLEDYLTPVQILVENQSGRALRIRPRNFSLVGPDGFRFDAVRPQEVWRILGYPYVWRDVYGVPPSAVASGATEPRATPPGTLERGGRASVLLFYPVPANRLPSATVSIVLVDAQGQRLGQVRVPFVRAEPGEPVPPPRGVEAPPSGSAAAPPQPSGPPVGPQPPANTPPER